MNKTFSTHVERIEGVDYLHITNLIATLTNEEKKFQVKLPKGTEPLVFFTATTGMIETIGNMEGEDAAIGYAFGESRHRFRVRNPMGLKDKARVYITEHLRLDGHPEYLVTTHKIAQGANNFVSVGYIENGKRVAKLIIDIITGEHKWLT